MIHVVSSYSLLELISGGSYGVLTLQIQFTWKEKSMYLQSDRKFQSVFL
jgi:hypothetical protein